MDKKIDGLFDFKLRIGQVSNHSRDGNHQDPFCVDTPRHEIFRREGIKPSDKKTPAENYGRKLLLISGFDLSDDIRPDRLETVKGYRSIGRCISTGSFNQDFITNSE